MSIVTTILNCEDDELCLLVEEIEQHSLESGNNLSDLVSKITRSTIDYILDGEMSLSDLEACEKAMFGVKFEKRVIRALGLPRKVSKSKNPHGLKLDTRIADIELDIKTTLGGKTWMIPAEALGHWVFGIQVDIARETVSFGFLKATPNNLRAGKNRDTKGSTSAEGMRRTHWLGRDVPY